MRRIFYLGAHQYEFRWWDEGRGGADRLRFEDLSSARDFLRSLLGDSFEVARVHALAIESRGGGLPTAESEESLLQRLAWDIFHGRLQVTKAARVYPTSLATQREQAQPAEPAAPAPTARRVERTDWIEIQLLDMEGNPVPNERWEVTWPDGSTVSEGRTDRQGVGRIDWIDPSGMCRITFPDLDRDAWERIS